MTTGTCEAERDALRRLEEAEAEARFWRARAIDLGARPDEWQRFLAGEERERER